MIPGYHTAGLLLHDVCVAVDELAHIGYSCVAIRPHAGNFHPRLAGFGQQVLRISDAIKRAHVRSVLDLDAPFMHGPEAVRGPSLVAADDDESGAAMAWIEQWVAVAVELGSEMVTFSSGATDSSDHLGDEDTLERLAARLNELLASVADQQVRLALRPRSGDMIATVAQFERLGQWLTDSSDLLLAADIGEMLIGGELPVGDRLGRNLDTLACVYLCDRQTGHFGDQRIGQGDVALNRILRSLAEHQFRGPAIVRVEGQSDLGFAPAREAMHLFDELQDNS